MSELTKEDMEIVRKFRESIKKIYTDKENAMFLGIYTTQNTDEMREAVKPDENGKSPLERVLEKYDFD